MRFAILLSLSLGFSSFMHAADQKKFLRSYSGQTTDQLIALESDHRVDSLVLAFEQAIQQKKKRSQVEIDILAVEAMEREVNNGGFHQFFLNSSREFAAVLPSALERIGCPITAKIASDALGYLKIEGEITPQKIRATLGKLGDKAVEDLGKMDGRYFEYKERIADRLFEYIKAKKKEVSIP
jgi:hypothetical protein